MHHRTAACCLLAFCGMIFPTALASDAEGALEPPVVPYWDNWTDKQGISHLTKCKLTDFSLKTLAPHAEPQWTQHAHEGQATVETSVQPAHWKGGWRANPQVQWIVPLSGTWFVQSMDGTQVELNAGEALLSEDVDAATDRNGHTGHLSGNVGDAPVVLLITQFRDAHASHTACPAR
ncbi:cupin domain-containing protein [Neoasaia chiangmaiensis]|uniref:Cupin n=1 Tax=Neoasaia chiangmaiensis TaxID=320497 RepID=A0A1U9KRT5_9PROT|nr:hypothetical protein [Neoasaia chiangmaiensis]AQS88419.1 hypothetical protein A0U93_11250 [Neoasaia chiangmaiensis]